MNEASLAAVTSSKVMDWCTPSNVLNPIYQFSPITFDPCSNPNSIVSANTRCSLSEGLGDGLAADWMGVSQGGLIFVNPPYGPALKEWMNKCFTEALMGCEIMALVPSRTDTKWWHHATQLIKEPSHPPRTAVCFWKGRIKFVGGKHCAPFPSALIYYGEHIQKFDSIFSKYGLVVL